MTTPHNDPKRETRANRPAASFPFFTLRVLKGKGRPTIQVAVPVRIEARATGRNRIKRQVAEALRVIMTEHHIHSHVAVLVRRADIPRGQVLRSAIFELFKESGMIEQR
ncbi:MAG TPA: ribonuclease P protein component [Candidatus Paceibacterota bacterium]|nr:ribonuclease P protein component [Candidatus Paceibacterota bacterium]